MIEKPKNAKGKYVEGATEVIYVYEKLEEVKKDELPTKVKEKLKVN
ncbi:MULTISPECIES: hypothetical protein [Bacillus]|nr:MULTISPECIES: hypothetical protein [Bacillus]EEL37354.1 hypothetical protein bcere0020_51830 [Bacillus cereus Rock3-29]MDF9888581.1 uncharacterized protein YxeA [Bacillus sp. LEw-kw-24]MDH8705511.1 uncharacterized protein YxeA [Stenotrophomonas sp. 1198]EJQ32420.1 hypothetical protein IEC_05432 [Bacillus toyonensis]EJV43854.1 hypothetical protein IEK_05193 [Bacillus toyonensis]